MTKELLEKFLNNSCTDGEVDEVIKWISTKALNNDSKNLGFQDWKSYEEDENVTDKENFRSLLDEIHHKIDIDNSKQRMLDSKISTSFTFLTWLTRAAAILLLPVLGILFYTISSRSFQSADYTNLTVDSLEIVAPIGSRTVMQLSDGSEVHLNYGSKLKYPLNFSGETREVILIGEGYFDVAHNPEKPFIVKTGKLNIKALGTAFNVSAYPDNDNIETTLVNGKVTLEQIEINGKAKSMGAMVPGQHVKYNSKTGAIVCTKGEISNYVAWKDGKLVFYDESISKVAYRLSHMFNVDIEIADNVLEHTYSVTFVDEPLFQILDLMTLATPIVYRTLPRKKLSDGTFSKQKILIEKKN